MVLVTSPLLARAQAAGDTNGLGMGSLLLSADGSQALPAGATVQAGTSSSDKVIYVSDKAVKQAVTDLASDFQKFLTSQQTMLTQNTQALSLINQTLQKIVELTQQSLQVGQGSGGAVSGYSGAGGSNLTAGYVTAANIEQAMGHAVGTVTDSLAASQGGAGGGAGAMSWPRTPVDPQTQAAMNSALGAGGGSNSGGGHPGGGGTSGGGSGLPSLGGGPPTPGKGLVGDIPVVGKLVSGVTGLFHKGYNTFMAQRQQNTYYQNMLGGTNANQLDVRASQSGFVHDHLGEASSITNPMYEDALQMGYRDTENGGGIMGGIKGAFGGHFGIGNNDPNSAVQGQPSATDVANTAYSLYHNQGISTSETMNMVSTMGQNGASSLSQVAQSLRDVTDAATEFGVNAVAVRQKLLGTFQAGTTAGFGAGAAPIADALTSAVTSGGKQMQGMDPSAMLTDQMTYRYSAQSGMTHGAFLAAANANPSVVTNAITSNVGSMISAFIPASALSQIDQEISQYGGQKAVLNNEALKEQIAQDVASANTNIDPTVLAQQLSTQAGVQVTAANVWYFIVNWRCGGTPSQMAAANAQKSAATTATSASISSVAKSGASQLLNGKQVQGTNTLTLAALSAQGSVGAHTLNDAYGKGQQSPVLSALANAVGNTNQMVRVNTQSGARVMTLADAMKQFPAEVEAGKVTMVGGKMDGQSVSQVTDGLVDGSSSTAAEAKKELTSAKLAAAQKGEKGNYTAAYYQSKYGTSAPASSSSTSAGGVTIGLTPQAQQLLQLVPSTAAASTGAPLSPGTTYGH